MIVVIEKSNSPISVTSASSDNLNLSVVKNNLISNVIVAKKKEIQISADATAGIINSSTPVTLTNTPTLSVGGVERLDRLKDVDVVEVEESDGNILTYDSDAKKWIGQKIDFTLVNLDGGNF